MSTQRDRMARLIDETSPLNGIDFVEIASNDQRQLLVHFLNAIAVAGTLVGDEPVTITGGETIPSVRVRTMSFSQDSQGRPLLALSVDAPGDFSNYILRVRSTILDRFYDRTTFSFKARCDSSLDCLVPPHECPPDDVERPAIDYLAKDFLSFRKALSDFSVVRYPEWKERSEADFGVMFLEALSAVADDLSYMQDRISREATLETATQRRSVVRHARLVDYEPRPAIAARVDLQFDVSADGAIPAQVRVAAQGTDATRVEFETGNGLADTSTYQVSDRWNRSRKLAPYIWDDRDVCVEAGSTELWITGKDHGFQKGQRLVIETAAAVAGDPPLREVVTVTDVSEVFDDLFGSDVTLITWGRDEALKKDHDISVDAGGNPRTTVSGNLVPATQGRTVVERFFIPTPTTTAANVAAARTGPDPGDGSSVQYFYTLTIAPLAWLMTNDQSTFTPEVRLEHVLPSGSVPWEWHRQLMDADSADLSFAIEPFRMRAVARNSNGTVSHEYDGDGGETLRFGDGTFGAAPPEGAEFEATYRVADGARGNVAPDSIRWVAPGSPALIIGVTNPFAATGGDNEETNERVRRLAPQAFRAKQFRAVRSEDYAAAAETLPWVSKAGTVFRWTGSWLTVFTTVDPKADEELSVARRIELIELLNRYRLAGYESYAGGPRYASIDLLIELCARPDAFRGDVEKGVLEALDTEHFFHPDDFTFGTSLERSALEAAVQEVPGVSGILSIVYRRRGATPAFVTLPQAVPMGRNEILRVENDPSRPERGSIRVRVKGGK